MKRVHLYISGRVQGVFFRANTRKQAKSLGVTGWVKNLSDGRVECVAEGEEGSVDELIKFCRKGPKLARVDNVEIKEEEPTGEFEEFTIKR